MPTSETEETNSSLSEQDFPLFFGDWLKSRRRELDLTQIELAERACCSVFALRKFEAGERRPSKQLAGMLGQALQIHSADLATFIRVARGEINIERLRSIAPAHGTGQSSDVIPPPTLINFPFQPAPLIGREAELAALGKLLKEPHCHLLTITGVGGIGKTRLALFQGEVELAESQFKRALRVNYELGYMIDIADGLRSLSITNAIEGDLGCATLLLGAATNIQKRIGFTYEADNDPMHQHAPTTWFQTDPSSKEWKRGEMMPLDEVVSYALGSESV